MTQNYNPERYAPTARFVSDLGARRAPLDAPSRRGHQWRAARAETKRTIRRRNGGAGNISKLLAAMVRALGKRGIDGSTLEFRYYPSVDEYREKLDHHGFRVSYIELIPRPTPLPGPLGDWFDNFGDVFLATVPAAEHDALKCEIEHEAATDLKAPAGTWVADYVRLRFRAQLD